MNDDATAQDVVDALRLAFISQRDKGRRSEVAEVLLEMAPETVCGRGTDLLLALIVNGSLAVEVS